MKVRELKELLNTLLPDAEVVVSSDYEGNSFHTLSWGVDESIEGFVALYPEHEENNDFNRALDQKIIAMREVANDESG